MVWFILACVSAVLSVFFFVVMSYRLARPYRFPKTTTQQRINPFLSAKISLILFTVFLVLFFALGVLSILDMGVA